MQIPTGALRMAMRAVMVGAGSAIVAEAVGSGCDSSNSAVMGSGTQAWGGNGQITGVAGSIDTGDGDGANGANKAGSGTGGTGMQAEGKGRGGCCSAGNFSGAQADRWPVAFGKGWAQGTGSDWATGSSWDGSAGA